jgi:hypothetical protein
VKRTGFARKAYTPPPAAPLRALTRPVNYGVADDRANCRPKENAVRSEEYRRLVAALPCAHCGIHGISQHAHENEQKGKSLKLDDRRAMPLCADQPGREGCHKKFDEYRLLLGGRGAHVAMGNYWAERTRAVIIEAGKWPKNLPPWRET